MRDAQNIFSNPLRAVTIVEPRDGAFTRRAIGLLRSFGVHKYEAAFAGIFASQRFQSQKRDVEIDRNGTTAVHETHQR